MLHKQISRVADKLDNICAGTTSDQQLLAMSVRNLRAISEEVECLEAHFTPCNQNQEEEDTHAA